MPISVANLTDADIANAEYIRAALKFASHDLAAGAALSITHDVLKALKAGGELCLQTADGQLEKVVMPELKLTRSKAETLDPR